MGTRDQSLRRKTMAVTLLTSLAVLLLTVAAFTVYDLATYRHSRAQSLAATAAIIADHSSSALAHRDTADGSATLNSLRADRSIVAAALYDRYGNLFVRFPAQTPAGEFPLVPGKAGYRFNGGQVVLFEPVSEGGVQLGTLYLQSEVLPLWQRLRFYGGIALLVWLGSALVALAISNALQRLITRPILALAAAARAVSESGDYSVRVAKVSRDETGRLTEAFNRMLARIEEQTETLRQSEERFRALVTASSDVVYRMSPDWSEMRYLRGRDFVPDTAAPSRAWLQKYIHPEDQPQVMAVIGRAIATRSIFELEHRVLRVDGGLGWTFSRAVPLLDTKGEIVEWFGAAQDITPRKRAEDQIRQLNAELEQRVVERTAELSAANKELEAFTYSVAHDLRAPLRHIDAFSEMLDRDFAADLPGEAQHYLKTIRGSSVRMSRLVDDLLNLARVGRQELRRQPTPLSQLVGEVVADLQRETASRKCEWHIAPLPAIECDPGLMKQVFTNLLSNAVKYTRPRPVAVIEVGCLKTNGNSAVFVRDNGVGFNMKYVDKLFGVFQRFHRADEFEGTGVGLATVDRIVRKHGGHIWAEAAVDQGATFYFTVAGLEPPATAT